ncbi:hypothetical protein GCM10022296_15450 [Secundilactobacillus similis DSM 23365 = JCM 2765]|uniref:Accessory Sec system protein Asp3 n=1 Tax=Secundilactobacillus similis DSM 23365 = JCM 2765 TaxID=1423804 RepID=A0A0R2FMK2_9LACO|nr:accessory Sec system protein Asp3 [Secundilactobacillus similis]KRN25709.1 hypothetical protein FD14_GL000113 [Secundilactobacillus similis DSM 23365 = JCM 2765]
METVSVFKWPRELRQTYNYGAQVSFEADETVSYSCPMMPPGTAIRTWSSRGSGDAYLMASPQLPLLLHQRTYYFAMACEAFPAKSVYAQLSTFDEQGETIDQVTFQELSGTFSLPDEVASYELSLMNTNHHRLTFYQMVLMPAELSQRISWMGNVIGVAAAAFDTPQLDVIVACRNMANRNYPVNTKGATVIGAYTRATFQDPTQLTIALNDLTSRVWEMQHRLSEGTTIRIRRWGQVPETATQQLVELLHPTNV